MRGFLFRPTLSVLTRLYAIFLVSVNARMYEGTNAYEGTSVEPTNVYERTNVGMYVHTLHHAATVLRAEN